MTFEALGLNTELLDAVRAQSYIEPTEIQKQAIPVILQGHDVLASAQTGTGKTASFALPILQLLNQNVYLGKARKVRALVLTPTRELAMQVQDCFQQYADQLPLKSTAVFGGVNITPQITRLKRGVDVLVATPGRLLDHLSQGTVSLDAVEKLVLDEADRMLDMGFIHDIRKVLANLPEERQNLLFSATYSKAVRTLSDSLLHKPRQIEVTPQNSTSERVEQSVYFIEKTQKRLLLAHLIKENNWDRVLIFTRTKYGADRLGKQLVRTGISAVSIHGDKSQNQRTRALQQFKANQVQVMVATDVAARGLDIEQLPHVVNYDLPNVAEDYVHRIGRTGRAGHIGHAVSLVCEDERKNLRNIEKLIGKKIPIEKVSDQINPGENQPKTPIREENEESPKKAKKTNNKLSSKNKRKKSNSNNGASDQENTLRNVRRKRTTNGIVKNKPKAANRSRRHTQKSNPKKSG